MSNQQPSVVSWRGTGTSLNGSDERSVSISKQLSESGFSGGSESAVFDPHRNLRWREKGSRATLTPNDTALSFAPRRGVVPEFLTEHAD